MGRAHADKRRCPVIERLFVVVVALSIAGCGGCGSKPAGPAVQSGSVALQPRPDEDVPTLNAVYQTAHDQAVKEITGENAEQKLDEIEQSVAREREDLR